MKISSVRGERKRQIVWERQRAQGKLRFILKFGLLWGLIMTIFTSFHLSTDGAGRVQTLGLNALIFLSFGLIGGWCLWIYGERKYQKRLKEIEEQKGEVQL